MPNYSVISIEAGDSYGHPTEVVLSRLQDAGAEIYRTDESGTIECAPDGERLYSMRKKAGNKGFPYWNRLI